MPFSYPFGWVKCTEAGVFHFADWALGWCGCRTLAKQRLQIGKRLLHSHWNEPEVHSPPPRGYERMSSLTFTGHSLPLQVALRQEDGDETTEPPPSGRRDRRRASLCSGGGVGEQRGLDRRRSRRHSVQSVRGPLSAPTSPCSQAAPSFKPSQVWDLREK